MKKIFLIILLVLPFFSIAQRKPKIKGNKSVTQVSEGLPAFNAIELNDDLTIKLKKSSSEAYAIEADDNLIDVLKFDVEDSTLTISSFYNITSKKKLDIVVSYKELKQITQRDGKIEMLDALSTDELVITALGSSKMDINASAFVAILNMEGNSKGDFNLDVDSLSVNLKNKADAEIYSISSVKNVELYNTASIAIEGTTDTLNLKMYNNTKFTGQKLGARAVNAQVEASTSARINALREIELKSRGNAKTYLYSDPKISILEFLDTSQLLKKEN